MVGGRERGERQGGEGVRNGRREGEGEKRGERGRG
jgi:hypothetical protein